MFGGSHGAFIGLHLAGQHPNSFRAVIARNPVVNKATKSQSSDIPDTGMLTENTPSGNLDPNAMDILYQCSPIAYAANVKAPIYLMLGKQDLRVPPSQGYSYYHLLKQIGNTNVQMNVYDDCHPLSKVTVQSDIMVNAAVFFEHSCLKHEDLA